MPRDTESASGAERVGTPALEYLSAAIGAALVLFVLGVVAWHAATGSDAPPDLRLTVAEIRQQPAGFAADFKAENLGERTAADVTVEGMVGDDSGTATLDFVPGGSEREGTLILSEDPRGEGRLHLRIRGFREP